MNPVYTRELVQWGEESCAPGHEFGGKRDYYLIHIILKGQGEFFSHKKKWRLGTGDAFLIQPGQMHLYRADQKDPWSYFWLGFTGEMDSLLHSLQIDRDHPLLHTSELDEVHELFKKLKSSTFTLHPALMLENLGIANVIFGKLCKDRYHSSQGMDTENLLKGSHVNTMTTYIQKYFNTPIQVQDVLDFVQLERSYASRLFRAEKGISIGKEILSRRIDLARQLLSDGYSGKETAYSCGFNDYNNFLKVFKRETGITAGSYGKLKS